MFPGERITSRGVVERVEGELARFRRAGLKTTQKATKRSKANHSTSWRHYAVYTVSLGSQPISGLNFDDFQTDTCVATNISYKINGCTTVTNLRGHTHQGDTVTVTFTIPAGKTDQVSLVSYTAPGSSFDASTASLQQIFQDATGTFSGGSQARPTR